MYKKRILVLGGSYMQSGFVETALRLGCDIDILDRDQNCLLNNHKKIIFKAIDIADVSLVEDYFKGKKFDAIIAPVSEIGNRTAAKIAQKYGLRYNSESTVIATTNKNETRKRLINSTLDEPRIYKITEFNNPAFQELKFPVFVKPAINSASRGVTEVLNYNQLTEAIEKAMEYCNSKDEILIEEAIKGVQYSIETISSEGKHYLVALTREHLSKPPYYMERMDVIDAIENQSKKNNVMLFVNKLLNALDVKVGPCHIEVKIDNLGVIRLIEIASRSGMLRDRLIHAASGEDYNELILKAYLGEEIREPQLPKLNAMLGVIAYKEDIEVCKRAEKDGVLFESYEYGKETVIQPSKLTDAVGYYFIRSNDLELFNNYKVKC